MDGELHIFKKKKMSLMCALTLMVSALPAGGQKQGRQRNEEFPKKNPVMSDLSEIAAAHSVLTA